MRRSFLMVSCLAMGACAPVVTNNSLSSGNRVELERRAEIRMQLATAYYSEGQYATALSELDQALQIGERKADVLGLRGLVLMQIGDTEAASKNLQQALQIEETHKGVHLANYGRCSFYHELKGGPRSLQIPLYRNLRDTHCPLRMRRKIMASV